jgi:hypothetical protein
MGYDRRYEPEEVHQMLYLSERRLRPTAPAARAKPGHAISTHTEQRENPFDRRKVAKDSTFESRRDLVLAVHEAINDPEGQKKLASLNPHDALSCDIVVNLSVTLGKIQANVVHNPMTPSGKPAQGPPNYLTQQLVSSVFVLVDKVHPADSWAPLHIQTAYPKDLKT